MKTSILASILLVGSQAFSETLIIDKITVEETIPSFQNITQPELFEKSVVIQETSPGTKNPIVYGMQGDQLSLSVNGIEMSNALFRSGPNQYYSWVPNEFVTFTEFNDGSNIGGTIDRTLGINESKISFEYDSGNDGKKYLVSRKGKNYEIGVMDMRTNNVEDRNGDVPHSSYNQQSGYFSYLSKLGKTYVLASESNDLDRTDKFAQGKVYISELQRYVNVGHSFKVDKFEGDLNFQKFQETILDGSTRFKSVDNIYTISGKYFFESNSYLYASGKVEDIIYKDNRYDYDTIRYGVGTEKELGNGFSMVAKAGGVTIDVTDRPDNFRWVEGNVKLSHTSGLFGSFDLSSRAPSIFNLNESLTTSSGTEIPNPNLTEETAHTYRFGYSVNGFTVSTFYKYVQDMMVKVDLGGGNYQIQNSNSGEIYGGEISYVGTIYDFNVNANLIHTFGRTETDYVSKITPLQANIYVEKNGAFGEFLYADAQDNLSSTDKTDFRIKDHNYGYKIWNVGYRTTLAANHRVEARINNLFDTQGRVLGSSVDFAGRSAVVNYSYLF